VALEVGDSTELVFTVVVEVAIVVVTAWIAGPLLVGTAGMDLGGLIRLKMDMFLLASN